MGTVTNEQEQATKTGVDFAHTLYIEALERRIKEVREALEHIDLKSLEHAGQYMTVRLIKEATKQLYI